MRLGLIADVHEEVELLAAALSALRGSVDRVVFLGDATVAGRRLDETCRLLAGAGAVGVWGNHDLGLCVDVPPALAARFAPATLDYMCSLRPRLDLGGCHFCHVEPWLDAATPEGLWYFDGPPDTAEKLARSFAAVPARVLFCGHFHEALLATPAGPLDWDGESPVRLDPADRYLVVVPALCDGRFATFDTDSGELTPLRVGPARPESTRSSSTVTGCRAG